ncbi:MAG: small multi-drug export protein [candidate division WOR-3 bacterium]
MRFFALPTLVLIAFASATSSETGFASVSALVSSGTGPALRPGLGARLALRLKERGVAPELVVMAIATVPIVELRGAVPVGINLLGLPWYRAVLFAVLGNMLPILLVLFLLERLAAWLSRIQAFARFFEWLFARTRRKSRLVERYEFWGLAVFVGIPLPMTGAWTGAVAAVIMGVPYWRALLSILLGVLMAAAVVTSLSLLGIWGAVIAGVALTAVAANAVVSGLRRRARRVGKTG